MAHINDPETFPDLQFNEIILSGLSSYIARTRTNLCETND